MHSAVAIRRLEATELPAYKALRDVMLALHPQAFSSDAAQARALDAESYRSRLGLEQPEGGVFTLGAWDGASLVGAIGCERDPRVKVRHIGHLVGMMVCDERQGRGIGRALLARCIDEARRADGLVLLTLSVTAGNLPAIALYERAGFVQYGSLARAICVDQVYCAKEQMALVL